MLEEVLLAQVSSAASQGSHGRPSPGMSLEGVQEDVQVAMGED